MLSVVVYYLGDTFKNLLIIGNTVSLAVCFVGCLILKWLKLCIDCLWSEQFWDSYSVKITLSSVITNC